VHLHIADAQCNPSSKSIFKIVDTGTTEGRGAQSLLKNWSFI
jgi:hypothetical protein